jgi:hypothetical protein
VKRLPAIDFLESRRPQWLGWGLIAVAAGLLAASGYGSWRIENDTRSQAARLKLAQAARAPGTAMSAADRLLLAQARSVATQLNAPWDELLAVFEEHSVPSVGLLKLEPDAKAAIVRVTAQAGDADAMVSYVEALESDARLTDVMLVNHQVEREIAGQPVRFTMLASWRPAALAAATVTRVAKGGAP